jgi:acetyltransferase-like isoleucine patch superfamily enzyme
VLNRIKNHQVESSSVALKARVGRKVIIRAGSEVGPGVAIGDYSYISGPMAYVEAAEIGKFCSIARQTVIGVSGHDYRIVTTHPFILDPRYGIASRKRREEQKPPPVIGHDVWIGINAVIHRGVRIGIGAVVASNAVVTKDVAPYSIVGGNPAKHIKYRFSDDLIQALLASEWWNWSDEKLASLAEDFLDPDVFAQKHAGNQDSPMGVEFARGE